MATLADNIPGRTGPYRAVLTTEQRTLREAVRGALRTREEADGALARTVADAWHAGLSLGELGRTLGYTRRHSGAMAAGRILDRELTRRRKEGRH